jgi:hypothetical protein
MTDCHVDMLAWELETGAPWDLKIARDVLSGCFADMLSRSPAAKYAIINQLGDWLHTDGVIPVTPTSGHHLDSDGRFERALGAALDILEWLITKALEKHEKVHLICAEGNHDIVSSIFMRAHFSRLFRDNPRVEVNDSKLPYYVYRHGKTMLAFHHGHKMKIADLPLRFAAAHPEIWGETKYRYGHSGHLHHERELGRLEMSGMKWRQHPTLAAPDAYSARCGWISKREARCITYHSEYGEMGELVTSPEMIAGGQESART